MDGGIVGGDAEEIAQQIDGGIRLAGPSESESFIIEDDGIAGAEANGFGGVMIALRFLVKGVIRRRQAAMGAAIAWHQEQGVPKAFGRRREISALKCLTAALMPAVDAIETGAGMGRRRGHGAFMSKLSESNQQRVGDCKWVEKVT